MIGGVVTSVIMELAVYPAIYYLWRSRGLPHRSDTTADTNAVEAQPAS